MEKNSELHEQNNNSNEIIFGSNLSDRTGSSAHSWIIQTLVILILLSVICGQAYKKYMGMFLPDRQTEAVELSLPIRNTEERISDGFLSESMEPAALEEAEYELFGMTLYDLPSFVYKYCDLPAGKAVGIVPENSLASEFGFIRDDIIISINSVPSQALEQQELSELSAGTAIVYRQGSYYTVTFP